jgi:acyl-CoA reductase-like NAD-dependent aldehyde dehydrogenase
MWEDPSEREKDEMIKKAAETIYKYDMDLVAILVLESIKPLASVGGQLGRYMVAPFVPFISEKTIPYMATFQDKKNVERLIKELEEHGKREEELRKKQKEAEKAERGAENKSWWRRILPF